MVVSRDGTQRYAMPYLEGTPEDPWPPDMLECLDPFPVDDIAQLATACIPLKDAPQDPIPEFLDLQAALAHYETLRARYAQEDRHRALWEMAQVTWPVQVMLMGNTGRTFYLIMWMLGQGMEDELWSVDGEENDREAVRLSIVMRNLLFLGNDDGHPDGYDSYLRYAALLVREVNRESATTG